MIGHPLVAALVLAFLIALLAVELVRRIAVRVEFLDSPDRWRKLHLAPVALGGGIGVWGTTWICWALFLLFGPTIGNRDARFTSSLILSSGVILALGLVDDRVGLRARNKLAGQFLAAGILLMAGLRVESVSFLGSEFRLGLLAQPVTLLWLLFIVNAYNLVDGMDGFCGSLGLIASASLAFVSAMRGRPEDAMISLALAGAQAGFLIFNFPPARIYLGDAGSMTIGLMVGALSIRAFTNGPDEGTRLLPMAGLLLLPILDSVTAIGRRVLNGRSIFLADRGHLHHCLKRRLQTTEAALALACGLALIAAVVSILEVTLVSGDLWIGSVTLALVVLLACTDTFCAAEIRLLFYRAKVALSAMSVGTLGRGRGIAQACRVQGTRDWTNVWEKVVRRCEASGFRRLELTIDMTALEEVYHAHWSQDSSDRDQPRWSLLHTIYAGPVRAGSICVSGNIEDRPSQYLEQVEGLISLVEGQLSYEVEPPLELETPQVSRVSLSVNSSTI